MFIKDIQKYVDKFNNSKFANDFTLLNVYHTDRTYYVVRCNKCGEISPRRFERIPMCSLNSPCTINKKVASFKKTVESSGLHQSAYWKSMRRKIAKDYYTNTSTEILNARNEKRVESLKQWHKSKQTHNFKSTTDEEYVYTKLRTKFNSIHRNWKTDKYPWYCDFYIEDNNTYIELNTGVFHYFEPFKGTSKQLKTLEVLKQKNTEFWDRVIYIWTESDVEKRNLANKNKLHYLEFYTLEDFDNWFTLQ